MNNTVILRATFVQVRNHAPTLEDLDDDDRAGREINVIDNPPHVIRRSYCIAAAVRQFAGRKTHGRFAQMKNGFPLKRFFFLLFFT